MGEVEDPDKEPSSDSILAGTASGEPSGIERHNMRFWGRYNADRYKPYAGDPDWIHIYNGGRYVIRIEVWPAGSTVGHGETVLINERDRGQWNASKGYGGIRISVVESNVSLVIDPDVRNLEIWMDGYTDVVGYWVGEF